MGQLEIFTGLPWGCLTAGEGQTSNLSEENWIWGTGFMCEVGPSWCHLWPQKTTLVLPAPGCFGDNQYTRLCLLGQTIPQTTDWSA